MLDHKYIIFYHLAKNPNTTKVAVELGLSQPAISKSIKELERELSVTLFHREKGRMQLTETGEYLLGEITPLLQKEREVLFELDKRRDTFSGTLHIGASTTLAQYILPELLSDFIRRNPDIHIHLSSGNTDQIEHEVLAGNLHLAFIEGTPPSRTSGTFLLSTMKSYWLARLPIRYRSRSLRNNSGSWILYSGKRLGHLSYHPPPTRVVGYRHHPTAYPPYPGLHRRDQAIPPAQPRQFRSIVRL